MKKIIVLSIVVFTAGAFASKKPITFKYQPVISGIKSVHLAGSFNSWNPKDPNYEMKDPDGDGTYEITIYLEPGRYSYKFVINGTIWVPDPNAEEYEPDGFGGKNSVIVVTEEMKGVEVEKGDGKIFTPAIEHKMKKPFIKPLKEDKSLILFRVKTAKGDVEKVFLVPFRKKEIEMKEGESKGDVVFYEAKIRFRNPVSEKLRYAFKFVDGNKTLWLSSEGISEKKPSAKLMFLYDYKTLEVFKTPAWAKNAVMYQIFPERFYNGDKSNDPDFHEKDLYFAFSKDGKPDSDYYGRFMKDWNAIFHLGDEKNGKRFFTFFGGDIVGVEKKLGYLKDLGITVIYFNPIFYAESNHKYDGADFFLVDPRFVLPRKIVKKLEKKGREALRKAAAERFSEFLKKAHKTGIRVIIDTAFNHTGNRHYAFRDSYFKGPKSKYYHWYEWKQWIPDVYHNIAPGKKVSDYYVCWWGFGSLPDLNYDVIRTDGGENPYFFILDPRSKEYAKIYSTIDSRYPRAYRNGKKIYDRFIKKYGKNIFDRSFTEFERKAGYPNWDVVEHILDVGVYWAKLGVDGYRLDVPNEVPFWFWKLFRHAVKNVNPDFYLVGEIWADARKWIGADGFDAVMNYKYFKDPVMDFIGKGKGTAKRFKSSLKGMFYYPEEARYVMMNLLDSHDTPRYLTAINGNLKRMHLTALFQMTFVGIPHIYYGDEIAMEGGKDPDDRRTFYWSWKKVPYMRKTRNWYKKLIAIRKKYSALRTGKYRVVLTEGKVFAFKRWDRKSELVVVINAGDKEVEEEVPAFPSEYEGKVKDLITGQEYEVDEGNIEIELKPLQGVILVKR